MEEPSKYVFETEKNSFAFENPPSQKQCETWPLDNDIKGLVMSLIKHNLKRNSSEAHHGFFINKFLKSLFSPPFHIAERYQIIKPSNSVKPNVQIVT